MRENVKRPLLIAAGALVLLVVVEVTMSGISDEGTGSDVRFIVEAVLALAIVASLVMAAVSAIRRT